MVTFTLMLNFEEKAFKRKMHVTQKMHTASKYEGRLQSLWTGGNAPLLCTGRR
jgi:hypothetical protein